MRDAKRRAMRAILVHQQPSREARPDLVKAKAGGGRGQLIHQQIDVAEQFLLQCRTASELATERAGRDSPGRALALHPGPQRHLRRTEHQLHADKTLAADHAHVERRTTFLDRDQRNDRVDREVRLTRRLARLAEHVAARQPDTSAHREQPDPIRSRKAFDEPIFGVDSRQDSAHRDVTSTQAHRPRRMGCYRRIAISEARERTPATRHTARSAACFFAKLLT